MTVANLFAKHRAGEVSKEKFLYEVRRDAQLPYISNLTSYDDAIKILKQKGIIKEAAGISEGGWAKHDLNKRSIMDADRSVVKAFLEDATREEIIEWLKWNDRHGEYTDEDRAAEGEKPLTKDEAAEQMMDQLEAGGGLKENSDYEEDTDDNIEDVETDYLEFTDGDTIVSMHKDGGGKWIESEVIEGDKPYGWGSKRYMGYLTPREIASYLSKDYGGKWTSYEGMEEATTEIKSLNEQEDLYHQIDRLNPILVKKAVNMELAKLPMIDAAIYQKTTENVVKKLQKDPRAYDDVLVSNAKEIHKADEKLKMQQVQSDNLKDKANEMKSPKGVEKNPKANVKASKKENKKGKPAGVKLMEAIKDILKKKLNEDTHHEYGVGQSIDVPEGHGTIKGMVGDTVTLEFEDGSQKDYQINALNHFREEAKKPKEEEMTPEVKKHEPTVNENEDEFSKSEKLEKIYKYLQQYTKYFTNADVKHIKDSHIEDYVVFSAEIPVSIVSRQEIKKFIGFYKSIKNSFDKHFNIEIEEIGDRIFIYIKEKEVDEAITAKTTDTSHNQDVYNKINKVPGQARTDLRKAYDSGKTIDI